MTRRRTANATSRGTDNGRTAQRMRSTTMTPDSVSPAPTPPVPDRRGFFQRLARWVTLGVGGVAAGVLGVPLVGFFFGALRKKAPEKWAPLGPAASFPTGETRLVTFD